MQACNDLLTTKLAELKAVAGVTEVKRVVCGGCRWDALHSGARLQRAVFDRCSLSLVPHTGLDFKIVTAVGAAHFGAWEAAEFKPEAEILAALKAIDGVSAVETQTYTFMTM